MAHQSAESPRLWTELDLIPHLEKLRFGKKKKGRYTKVSKPCMQVDRALGLDVCAPGRVVHVPGQLHGDMQLIALGHKMEVLSQEVSSSQYRRTGRELQKITNLD